MVKRVSLSKGIIEKEGFIILNYHNFLWLCLSLDLLFEIYILKTTENLNKLVKEITYCACDNKPSSSNREGREFSGNFSDRKSESFMKEMIVLLCHQKRGILVLLKPTELQKFWRKWIFKLYMNSIYFSQRTNLIFPSVNLSLLLFDQVMSCWIVKYPT